MAMIQLKAEEAALLREILSNALSDLRMEVANTDSMDFRERLKAKERYLQRLLEQLGE